MFTAFFPHHRHCICIWHSDFHLFFVLFAVALIFMLKWDNPWFHLSRTMGTLVLLRLQGISSCKLKLVLEMMVNRWLFCCLSPSNSLVSVMLTRPNRFLWNLFWYTHIQLLLSFIDLTSIYPFKNVVLEFFILLSYSIMYLCLKLVTCMFDKIKKVMILVSTGAVG